MILNHFFKKLNIIIYIHLKMLSFMKECDSGIWFKEEDPDDEAYDPKCCTNVYLDYVIGKFDIINTNEYDEYDYDADNEKD